MRYRIIVKLKDSVLDPQGQTILSAIKKEEYDFISDIRTGKFFDLQIDEDTEDVDKKLKKLAYDILSNPIVEDFVIEEMVKN